MSYISNTSQEKEKMLKTIGKSKIEDLFKAIPEEVLFTTELNIPEGLSELELLKDVKAKAERNTSLNELNSFLGAGAYDHYVPSIIDHIISRSEFYTAYTPYQAELSQGSLQAIYEYQSMICQLTGMEVANASLLDGGSAVGEAVLMASRVTRKKDVIIPKSVHPAYREVARTYGKQQGLNFIEPELDNTITDLNKLKSELNKDTAAVVIQYPNFFGSIEDINEIKEMINSFKRTLLLIIANPIALALLQSPGNLGADIVIGEGQSLGNAVNYGGPYLGFMACKEKYLRQMPGRIVGATTDVDGKKGYVMTLQTREQHIRRERATSNICTNEALNALIATIYLSVMGKNGLRDVAEHCLKKAHYLSDRLNSLPGYQVLNQRSFFHEFLLKTPVDSELIYNRLKEIDILPGVQVKKMGYELDSLLICVTEKKTRDELDQLINALEEVSYHEYGNQ
ncbi:MAG: aminomethyl-transferring glycine dehydrogenase subunit GcvPA [Halanaerobiales bacterium]